MKKENTSIVEKVYEAGRSIARTVILGSAIYGATLSGGCASAPSLSPAYTHTQQKSEFFNLVKNTLETEAGEEESEVTLFNYREAQAIGVRGIDGLVLVPESVYGISGSQLIVYSPTAEEAVVSGEDSQLEVGAEESPKPFETEELDIGESLAKRLVSRLEKRSILHESEGYRAGRRDSPELGENRKKLRTIEEWHSEALPGYSFKVEDLRSLVNDGESNAGLDLLELAIKRASQINPKIKAALNEGTGGYWVLQIGARDGDNDGELSPAELSTGLYDFTGRALLHYNKEDNTTAGSHRVGFKEKWKDQFLQILIRAEDAGNVIFPSNVKVAAISPAVEDGTVEDGTVEDGTVEDGTVEDGTAEDGTVEDGTAEEELTPEQIGELLTNGILTLPTGEILLLK